MRKSPGGVRVCDTQSETLRLKRAARASNMKKDELKSLLQQPEVAVERQPGCPDDYQLAAYMDVGLNERDHQRFELHLADCAWCIGRVGIIGRAGEVETTVPVLELSRTRWRPAPRWAVAAVLVLIIGVGSQLNFPYLSTQPIDIRETRNIDPGAMGPSFLSPLEGMTITPATGVFNWTAVPASLYYQVRIVSDEGDLLWKERVNATQWGLPGELSLAPGAEYYVRVDAYLAEAKTLNSDYLLFRIEKRQ